MNDKVIIKSNNSNNNVLLALIFYMNSESIEYEIIESINQIDKNTKTLICLNENNKDKIPSRKNLSVIMISAERNIIKNNTSTINYIITNLINDYNEYTKAQKDYLFNKGIFHNILQVVDELIKNNNNYNGIIYDLNEMRKQPEDWLFSFESINETYKWLTTMNRNLKDGYTQKIISFYSDKVYNDSLNEINYLSDRLSAIKNKKQIVDIFICTNEEFSKNKNNFFFKVLIQNICDTYNIYLADKEEIMKNDFDIYNKLLDGIIIYDDCVYKDTYNDEVSLGMVDCKKESVIEFNKYFDYIKDKYGHKLNREGDIDEF